MGQGPQSVKKRSWKMELDPAHEGAYKPHSGFLAWRAQMSPWILFFCFSFEIFAYFCLLWVFVAACGLSLVLEIEGLFLSCVWASLCAGLLLLWSTGFTHAGSVVAACWLQSTDSVVVAQELSCPFGMWDLSGPGSKWCPCIAGRILNHQSTRETLEGFEICFASAHSNQGRIAWGWRQEAATSWEAVVVIQKRGG